MTINSSAYQGSAIGYAQVSAAGGFIPEIWSNDIKKRRIENLVMRNAVTMLPMLGANKGDVVHIPEIRHLSVNDKVFNNPVTLQSNTESEYTMIVDKYKEVSFMIEDIVKIQGSRDLMRPYTEEAGLALARDIERSLLAERATIQGYNSQSNVIYVTDTGAFDGTPGSIDRASLLAAKEILDEADVPQDGRFLIISPSQLVDMLAIDQFISSDYIQGRPTQDGRIGTLYGVPVWVTNSISATTTTAVYNGDPSLVNAVPAPGVTGSPWYPTQIMNFFGDTVTPSPLTTDGSMKCAIMGHRDWCRMAINLNPKVEQSRENLFQADAVVSTQVYGVKCYRPDHAVLIYSL